MRYLMKFRDLDPDVLVNEIKDYMKRNAIELEKASIVDIRDSTPGVRTITGTIHASKGLTWRRKVKISIRVVGQMPGAITMITNVDERGADTAAVENYVKDFQENLKLFFGEYILESRNLSTR